MNDIHERIPSLDDDSASTVHPIAYEELPSNGGQNAPILNSMNPLHRLKARVTVRVGGAELTVGDLMSMKVDQLLILDSGLSTPVNVMVEGSVIARGELVAVEDRFAVRVTQLPTPLKD
ncbi:MAG: FliM/FliN family flagellar motor switch protein [Rhodocyclaceae bacterium]